MLNTNNLGYCLNLLQNNLGFCRADMIYYATVNSKEHCNET